MLVYPNAKINLGLNVVERRADGYHNIETIFYPIGILDVLSIEPSDTCSDYSFSLSGIAVNGDVEDNLIVKAYRLLRSEYEFPPVDISLHKQIPFGAGLGGGSADAAFTLKALNELFELNISDRKLEKLAGEFSPYSELAILCQVKNPCLKSISFHWFNRRWAWVGCFPA